MGRNDKQMMLWVTEVSQSGDGSAVVTAKQPVLEGGIIAARKALGGLDSVTRDDVYRLREEGFIKARKLRPGKRRKDGRASNTKWIFDLVSCAAHKQRMEKEGNTPKEEMLKCDARGNCDLFGNHG